MRAPGLSKSRIIAWKQCPKRLWLQVNRRDLLEVSDGTARAFQIGDEVGEVARSLHPGGILIEHNDNLSAAVSATKEAMLDFPKKPIFEAAFEHDGVLVRADVLLPAQSGYRMVEVKSSTGVKDYQLDDCAVQAWVIKNSGIKLASIELAYIDTSFNYLGDGNYQGLFQQAAIDPFVIPLVKLAPSWAAEARRTLQGSEPDVPVGAHCDDPFECPFKAHCTQHLDKPPEYPLEVLYRLSAKKKELLRSDGIEDALDVSPEILNETQKWIQRVSRTGIPEISAGAGASLAALPYPRYYLDFETITFAVPRWANTRPYATQVPFQWSCHIEEEPGQLAHQMFLDVSGADPRRECAEALVRSLGTSGPVFVYYQAFEMGRITELASLFPDLSDGLNGILKRIVDLLPIAREHYYHPAMMGSWSIKAVLPTIAPDLRYDVMEVGDGDAAQAAYKEIIRAETTEVRKLELTAALRDYCELDTMAMVRLAWFFQKVLVA